MIFLPVVFVCVRFRLWVLMWFVLLQSSLLSFHYPLLFLQVSCPFGFVFLSEGKKFTNRSPTGNPGLPRSVIEDFVIRSWTDHWDHETCSWSVRDLDHRQIIRWPSTIGDSWSRVHDQIMNTWLNKSRHVDHDPLGDFRPLQDYKFIIVLIRVFPRRIKKSLNGPGMALGMDFGLRFDKTNRTRSKEKTYIWVSVWWKT